MIRNLGLGRKDFRIAARARAQGSGIPGTATIPAIRRIS